MWGNALLHPPDALDFCMWLSWRTYGTNRPLRIPLFGERALAAQLGTGECLRERDFRPTAAPWIAYRAELVAGVSGRDFAGRHLPFEPAHF